MALTLSVRSAELPSALKSSPEMTSIGTVESAAERGLALRVPTVTTSSMTSSCAMVVAGRTADTAKATAAASSVRGCFILFSPIGFVFTLLITIEMIA